MKTINVGAGGEEGEGVRAYMFWTRAEVHCVCPVDFGC